MSIGLRIRKEGTLRGMANEVWADMQPRAIVAVEQATDRTLATVRSLLSRGGDPVPGEAPKSRTGDLMRSWRVTRLIRRKYSILKGVESMHPAAVILEFGGTGKGGVKRLPFPYLRPAFERLRSVYAGIFAKV
jgi:hypothetical protein